MILSSIFLSFLVTLDYPIRSKGRKKLIFVKRGSLKLLGAFCVTASASCCIRSKNRTKVYITGQNVQAIGYAYVIL